MGLLSGSSNGSVVDAVAFFDSDVPKLLGELVSMGLLCAVGSTRDRGAVSIQITNNGEFDREYFRRSDEASDWLRHAVTVYRAAGFGAETQQAAAVQTPRRTRQKLT